MRYHFIGIGGIGMSALAHIVLERGCKVTGSDIRPSYITEKLQKAGATIAFGHLAENIQNEMAVVYSTDIAAENVEYQEALKRGLVLLHRSELLARLMDGYQPLLVTGTHGKTTTSSLLTHLLVKAGLDPAYAIGGVVCSLDKNGGNGKGPYFVAEADESDGSFLKYPCSGAIITNIDNDHLAHWKTEEALLAGFKAFAEKVRTEEFLFWCADDARLASLKLKGFSYGFNKTAALQIQGCRQVGWKLFFDFSFKGRRYGQVEIPLIGMHNVLNAAAVFGLGLQLEIPEEQIRLAFATFQGVKRRAEKKGETSGISFYDDYAHHPTEISTTLSAFKSAIGESRLIVAFQPHRYTRTRDCLEQFPSAFDAADALICTDIYAAGESTIPGITTETLLEKIQKKSRTQVTYVSREDLTHTLTSYLRSGDVVVTMGAGDITKLAPQVIEKLQHEKEITS